MRMCLTGWYGDQLVQVCPGQESVLRHALSVLKPGLSGQTGMVGHPGDNKLQHQDIDSNSNIFTPTVKSKSARGQYESV